MLSSILKIYMIFDIQDAVQQGLLLDLYILFFKFTLYIYISSDIQNAVQHLNRQKNFKISSRSNATKKMF